MTIMNCIIKDIMKARYSPCWYINPTHNLIDDWGDCGTTGGIHYEIDDTYNDFDEWYSDAVYDFVNWYVDNKFYNKFIDEEVLTASDVRDAIKYEKENYGESSIVNCISDDDEDTFNKNVIATLLVEYLMECYDTDKIKEEMMNWYDNQREEEEKENDSDDSDDE
jgi:hypothetical protein